MTVHVFHKNELWLEADKWVPTMKLPPQSYILDTSRNGRLWYLTQRFGTVSNALPITVADIPDWVRTCCLLLNLQV